MTESLAEKDPNLFMRVMRERDLTLSPEERQIPASDQFPKVYGLLMEWQNGPAIFTMSVTGAGEANLYTTAGFGLLGKNANSAALQNGARYFVEAAQQFHDVAKPVNEFPYPSSERPHFYLLTYSGVRLLELDAEAVSSPTSPFGMLLGRGQDVSSTLQMLLTAHSAGEPTDSAPANSTNLNAARVFRLAERDFLEAIWFAGTTSERA
jgi:hypothetical protein